jgi:hypothetical protein
MNKLEVQSSLTYRAEIFTESVSHQDHSFIPGDFSSNRPLQEGEGAPLKVFLYRISTGKLKKLRSSSDPVN